MMKFSFSPFETPPDAFRYKFPDGTLIKQNHRQDWYDRILKHYRDNEYPIPDNWKEIAEDQLCKLLPVGFCKQADGGDVMQHIDTRLTAGQIYHGAVTLLNIFREGGEALVPLQQAEERAKVCTGCPANIGVSGCLPCMKVSELIMDVAGPNRKTKSDQYLKSCACCGCPTASAVHIRIDILSKARSQDMNNRFALVKDWCWQEKERAAAEKELPTA